MIRLQPRPPPRAATAKSTRQRKSRTPPHGWRRRATDGARRSSDGLGRDAPATCLRNTGARRSDGLGRDAPATCLRNTGAGRSSDGLGRDAPATWRAGSHFLFDGLEGEEQFLPAAEAGVDGELVADEVAADAVEGGCVIMEHDAQGFLVVGVQGAGEDAAGV